MKKSDDQDEIIKLASKVCDFLETLPAENMWDIPYDDFAYAQALLKKEEDPGARDHIFSTDDKFFLHFKEEISKKFGLKVMSHEEAIEYKRKHSTKFFTSLVTGMIPAKDLPN